MNKQQLSPANRAYVEQFLGKVAVERAQATEEETVQQFARPLDDDHERVRETHDSRTSDNQSRITDAD